MIATRRSFPTASPIPPPAEGLTSRGLLTERGMRVGPLLAPGLNVQVRPVALERKARRIPVPKGKGARGRRFSFYAASFPGPLFCCRSAGGVRVAAACAGARNGFAPFTAGRVQKRIPHGPSGPGQLFTGPFLGLTSPAKDSIKMALARFQKGRKALLFPRCVLRRNICRT